MKRTNMKLTYLRMVITSVLFVVTVAWHLTAAQSDWDEDEDSDGKTQLFQPLP